MAKSDFFRLNLKKVSMLRLVIRFRSEIFFWADKAVLMQRRWIKVGSSVKGVESWANQEINNLRKELFKTTKGIKALEKHLRN